ncbi:MAG: RrF2 family transcriptional regulator [Candidatus Glassbacteria bacterium]
MLNLSKATDYALLFLTNLARQPDRHWNVRSASERLHISRRFLANITHQLARNGIIATSKGPRGGVTLLKSPAKLTIGDVVEIFEGPVSMVDCVYTDKTCERGEKCMMYVFWKSMSEDIRKTMHTTTLADLGEN